MYNFAFDVDILFFNLRIMLSCIDTKIVASINKIYYDVDGAMNVIGTRSGLEDSSLNDFHSCAPFLYIK